MRVTGTRVATSLMMIVVPPAPTEAPSSPSIMELPGLGTPSLTRAGPLVTGGWYLLVRKWLIPGRTGHLGVLTSLTLIILNKIGETVQLMLKGV